MLKVESLHAYYGLSHILQGVNIAIDGNKIIALLGRNGVGKTTTLKSIMRLVPKIQGEILFDGVRLNGLATYRISQLGIAYVPEDRRIFPRLSVLQNLRIGMSNLKKREPNHEAKRLSAIYGYFPILEKRIHQKGGSLSGGEQQMLAIARAMMGTIKLMLLDEPSEGLAPIVVELIKKIIIKIRDEGIGVLLVEQNAKAALEISDFCYVMEKGAVVYTGKPSEVLGDGDIKGRLCV